MDSSQSTIETKFTIGNFRYKVTLIFEGNRIFVKFPYSAPMIEEVKNMEGSKWHGFDETNPRKIWSIANSPRNHFAIEFLTGLNPYEPYDSDLQYFATSRKVFNHQLEFINHILTRRQCIIAGEMGTGKTLAAIEAMEMSGFKDWLYIAPRLALLSVDLEFMKWQSKIIPKMMTYEGLLSCLKDNRLPELPHGVIFDESSRIKTPTAQRSQAAKWLADAMRETYGRNCFIVEMSGSPAPKSPVDWWHQGEVACPGFLREGSVAKLKKRLALIIERESLAGGVYPQLVTWLDDSSKCAVCGQLRKHELHTGTDAFGFANHDFKASENEVFKLYSRMKGLVMVKFKKDCLDLPDKTYKLIKLEPSVQMNRLASMITNTSARAIQALTLLRELSDGFQYSKTKTGVATCPKCQGKGELLDHIIVNAEQNELTSDKQLCVCDNCNGSGAVDVFETATNYVGSPKEDALREYLIDSEDVGRAVVYAAFTASLDRCVEIGKQSGWCVIRVDGRGNMVTDEKGQAIETTNPLKLFEFDKDRSYVFVGQPGAAGMGVNLTASPSILYYSNTFKAEDRIQSEDRIHRIGMDTNRGATIIDLIHLPTDQLILDNLKKKRDLQNLSLGEVKAALDIVTSR